jgi:hypothetical protein
MERQIETAQTELEDAGRRKRETEESLENNKRSVMEKMEEKEAVRAEMEELTERRKWVSSIEQYRLRRDAHRRTLQQDITSRGW